MRKFTILLCSFLFLASCDMAAQTQSKLSDEEQALSVVKAGMLTLKSKGPDEAIKILLKDGPLEGDKDAMSQSNNLHRIEDLFGKFQSWDLIGHEPLGSKLFNFYAVLNYAQLPIYAKFGIYRTEAGWVLISFTFNSAVDKVLPSTVADAGFVRDPVVK